MTFTGHLWALYALTIACCLVGFAFGVCAMLGPRQDRPEPERPPARPPLPQAGRFTLIADRSAPWPPATAPADLWDTVPLALLSEHYALLDATGREADQLDAAWRRKYLP